MVTSREQFGLPLVNEVTLLLTGWANHPLPYLEV